MAGKPRYDLYEGETYKKFSRACRLLGREPRTEITQLHLAWLREAQQQIDLALHRYFSKVKVRNIMAGEKIQLGKRKPKSGESAIQQALPGGNGGGVGDLLGALGVNAGGIGDLLGSTGLAGGVNLGGGVTGQSVDLTHVDLNLGISEAEILKAAARGSNSPAITANEDLEGFDSETLVHLVAGFEQFRADTVTALTNLITAQSATQDGIGQIAKYLQKTLGEIGGKIDTAVAQFAAGASQTPPTASTPAPAGPASVPTDVAATLRAAHAQLHTMLGGSGSCDAAEIATKLQVRHTGYTVNQIAQFMLAMGYVIRDGKIIIS